LQTVYTFLATLVLLLGVSAAIVIRSLLLRRRHRRMIEEAIRNGTWVPPAHGGGAGNGGRQKVDLSKKPKMWEAFLAVPGEEEEGKSGGKEEEEKHEEVMSEKGKGQGQGQGGHKVEHVEWESIMVCLSLSLHPLRLPILPPLPSSLILTVTHSLIAILRITPQPLSPKHHLHTTHTHHHHRHRRHVRLVPIERRRGGADHQPRPRWLIHKDRQQCERERRHECRGGRGDTADADEGVAVLRWWERRADY
jgi:hypothetical protein